MLLRSPIRRLKDLVASPPLEVGDVTAVGDDVRTVALIGGGTVLARGQGSVSQRVYVRGGVIEGPAPTLPTELIEV